jgi:putative YphP/YqiW family bacilliredoxin
MMQPLYDPEAVRPMWEELAQCGVEPLTTAEAVDEAMKAKGTTLVMVNSVCGCAAGSARPGVTRALQHKVIPDHLKTVFAGVDRDATERARRYMVGIQPSSPSVALFKDGELVYMLERRHIERLNDDLVAQALIEAFEKFCSRTGPSVPKEVYESVETSRRCGSSVPLFNPFATR